MITKKSTILVSATLSLLLFSGCGGNPKPTKKYTAVKKMKKLQEEKVKKSVEKSFVKKIDNLGISIITFKKPLKRDNEREVLYDPNRQVIWQDNKAVTIIKRRDWKEAKAYCRNLTFAGSSDWRLPTIEELLNITDDTKYDPDISDRFKYVSLGNYWSSNRTLSFSYGAWDVLFKYGYDRGAYKLMSYAVRCIRDSKTLRNKK